MWSVSTKLIYYWHVSAKNTPTQKHILTDPGVPLRELAKTGRDGEKERMGFHVAKHFTPSYLPF